MKKWIDASQVLFVLFLAGGMGWGIGTTIFAEWKGFLLGGDNYKTSGSTEILWFALTPLIVFGVLLILSIWAERIYEAGKKDALPEEGHPEDSLQE